MVPEELTPEIRADAEDWYRKFQAEDSARDWPDGYEAPEPFSPTEEEIEAMYQIWQAQFGPKVLND